MGKPTEMDPDDCVRLVVENNNWSAMHVSVECDGRHFRLGTVRSQETEAFLVKDWMLGSALKYRLRALPVAGGTEGILTRFVPVDLEGLTHLMLEPTIWLSTVVVR